MVGCILRSDQYMCTPTSRAIYVYYPKHLPVLRTVFLFSSLVPTYIHAYTYLRYPLYCTLLLVVIDGPCSLFLTTYQRACATRLHSTYIPTHLPALTLKC
ncbi:hypothetical protein F4804DRAFT_327085 [Jackrogersella minutella]|nr:hypothetical protein F4804DRAFT_327085 [Jackrogersella minutella]